MWLTSMDTMSSSGNSLPRRVAAVGPTLGRELDSLGLHDVVDILDRGEPAGDVDTVVVSAQQEVAAEVELLQDAVTGELVREVRLQS